MCIDQELRCHIHSAMPSQIDADTTEPGAELIILIPRIKFPQGECFNKLDFEWIFLPLPIMHAKYQGPHSARNNIFSNKKKCCKWIWKIPKPNKQSTSHASPKVIAG